MSEMNGMSEDLRVDLMIDNVIAGRDLALTGVSPDETLLRQLSRLDEIDWPAEEVGDRIAASVTAPAPERRPRSVRSRWLVAGAAVAAVALAALAIQATISPHSTRENAAPRDSSGPAASARRWR